MSNLGTKEHPDTDEMRGRDQAQSWTLPPTLFLY